MHRDAPEPTVAIIGGGFTGAAVAFHLALGTPVFPPRIVVAEPRERIGGGLAYSTQEPAFRINVPADKMSLIAGQPRHFRYWLNASGELDGDEEARASAGRVFPRRAVFGRYVAEQIEPLIDAGRVDHRRDRAISIVRTRRGFSVSFEKGPPLDADLIVLAATHPPAAIPAPLRTLTNQPGVIADIYPDRTFDRIALQDRVLIVGNDLSAADAVAALDARGHIGPIVRLSRRGLRSRGHAESPASWSSDFGLAPPATALDLLQAIRRDLEAAAGAGASWYAVFDALREQAPATLPALDWRHHPPGVRSTGAGRWFRTFSWPARWRGEPSGN